MHFIGTPVFSAVIRELMAPDEYRLLQLALVLRPGQGALIPGTGGLRKLRWSHRGRGRRGGSRIIYYWHGPGETFYMLMAYAKSVRSDLTRSQLRTLRRLVHEEFG